MAVAPIALACCPPSARDHVRSGDVMRRFLFTVATATTALVGTACSDSTGLGSNVAGSYELRTINGQSLPVNTGSRTIEGGVVEVDSDGRVVDVFQLRGF